MAMTAYLTTGVKSKILLAGGKSHDALIIFK
jgi:hypothetical protein